MSSSDLTQIRIKVLSLLAQTLNKDVSSITPETKLEDLGADSLDLFEMVMKLEEAFSIEISDDAFAGLNTVEDVVALVSALKKAS